MAELCSKALSLKHGLLEVLVSVLCLGILKSLDLAY